jgi:hypothetical protein
MLHKLVKIIIMLLIAYPLFSQSQYDFNCNTSPVQLPPTPMGMGLTKPMKTLPANDPLKYFRVLMLFVEFQNDNSDPTAYWQPNSLPPYSDQLFAPQKQLGITAYEQYKISDYFNKVSRDQFDMIGDVYHVILPHDYNYYYNGPGFNEAQLDVFRTLDSDPNFPWDRFDRWQWNDLTQQYEQAPDGNIDMIYVQYRHVNMFNMNYGGFGGLNVEYITTSGKQIHGCSICYIGSGVTGLNGANLPREAVVGLFRHEYCHFALGNHKPYSTVAGNDGHQTALGYELGFAPMDMIAVGYDNTINFNPTVNSYSIGDLHSTGDIIKIPTSTPNEFFLVSNRRRIVGDGSGLIYDCNMVGDTAMGVPYLQFKDYSKGLYIYHVNSGNTFDYWPDLECADGLWNWQYAGYTTTPDWDLYQQLPVIVKTSVSYDDDNPIPDLINPLRLLSRDGYSVCTQNSAGEGYNTKWFTKGKRHVNLGDKGTDRIYTNLNEDYCSRETMGDRWDAWATGYNEVFSPYSSPNTKDRNNNQTGIFVYYKSLFGNTASVIIYQGAAGTPDETTALANTPPSRPMNIQVDPTYQDNTLSPYYNKITWNHNMEPDMRRNSPVMYFKRYKVYRASAANMNLLPDEYNATLIATVDINENTAPSYVDYSILSGYNSPPDAPCPPICWTLYPVRYRVVAVDNTEWASVKSDFAASTAWNTQPNGGGIQSGDNPHGIQAEIPGSFKLYANYPNPFNPSTEIKYDLPQNTFVTIKVYNILGEEIILLVNNEFKNAGRYSVTLDGTNLASGIYFYKIEAGSFVQSKKMVLIK